MDSGRSGTGEGKGEMRGEELVCRGRRLEEVERWERIRESRYNRWYGVVKSVGGAGELKGGVGGKQVEEGGEVPVGERDERRAVLGGGGRQKVQDVWVGGGDVGTRVGGVYGLGAGEGVVGSGEGGVE